MRNPQCKDCSLCDLTNEINVPGFGDPQAPVVIVTETPLGKSGNPFKSGVGGLIKKFLTTAGFNLKDVFITHLIGCNVPPKTKIKGEHIRACRKYLEEEIKEVNPEWTMILGATALKFIKKTSIMEAHATPQEFEGRNYFPTISPSIVFRDPTKQVLIDNAFEKFKQLVDGTYEEPEEIEWCLVTSDNLDQFLKAADQTGKFSFDIETTGLLAQAPDFRVNCISFTFDDDVSWVLPLYLNEDRKWARAVLIAAAEILKQNKAKAIAHNGKFDNSGIYARYGLSFRLYWDTMLCSHTLNENSPHDLKYLAKIYCGAPEYDDLTLAQKTGKDLSPQILHRLYRYNAMDTYYTMQLYKYQKVKLRSSRDLNRLFRKLVIPIANRMEKIDYIGHEMDLKKMAQVRVELVNKIAQLTRELQKMAGTKKIVNWGSSAQVAKLLYDRLGIPCQEYTPEGRPSTAESALIELKDDYPIINKLLEWRGLNKQLNTYIDGFQPLMIGSRLYISTKLHGTVTGRFSSRLHQTPRDGTIRNIFTAPPGYVFFCADFSQIELRLVAHISGDQRLIFIYQTGGDVHVTTAQEAMGVIREPTKEERKAAKAINFGYVYGMGWRKFKKYAKEKYGVELTDAQAKAFRDRFFRLYSGLKPWHERVSRDVTENGAMRYLSGRYRRLPEVYSKDEAVRAEAIRQAINSPVQGFGSGDLKVMAMLAIMDHFHPDLGRHMQLGDEVILTGEVHDSIIGWLRVDKALENAKIIKELMEHPPLLPEFEIELSVPLIAEVDVGKFWGDPDYTLEGVPTVIVNH